MGCTNANITESHLDAISLEAEGQKVKSYLISIAALTGFLYFLVQQRILRKSTSKKIPSLSLYYIAKKALRYIWSSLDPFNETQKAIDEFGNIFKASFLGYKVALLNEPAHIQKLLSSSNPGHLGKPDILYGMMFNGNIKRGLVCSDYETWKPRRKFLQRLFVYNDIQNQLNLLNHHSQKLLSDLQAMTNSTEYESNLKDTFQRGKIPEMINHTALENILHFITGGDAFSKTDFHRFHNNLVTVQKIGSMRILRPWLLSNIVWMWHPQKKRADRATAEIREFFNGIVERHRINLETLQQNSSSESEPNINGFNNKPLKCMIDEMLENGFSDDEIFYEFVTFIVGGHETISGSTIFLLLQFALNPEIQERCRREIDELFSEKRHNGASMNFSMHDLNSLEYLDRCIKENLRLAPIFQIFLRQLEAPLEIEDDLAVETGTIVAVLPWLLHRRTEIYPDPEVFNPDRFLPEECGKRHRASYIPFSAGVRNCIGWRFGTLSIKLLTTLILRHFLVESEDKWENFEFEFDTTVATKEPIHLALRNRPEIRV